MKTISRKNPIPLYIQLKNLIIEKVEKGEWQTGELIPTELELGNQFNLSRTTVRQGLTELVSDGVLERFQGKGTYVSTPKLEPIRPDLTGFTQDMKGKGKEVRSIVLNQEMVPVNGKIQRVFNRPSDSEVLHLERIRLVDGTPIGHHNAYLNLAVTPGINLEKYDLANESLYQSLAKENVLLGESEETVEACNANEYESDLLNIPIDSLLLKLTRLTRLSDGNPFEYVTMFYRADKYRYSVKLR